MKYGDGSESLAAPTVAHVKPSADWNAVTVSARSSSFNQYGAVAVPAGVLVATPPAAARCTNAGPLPAVRNIDACAALGVSESRIITPPLLAALTSCTAVTRAMMLTSPLTCLYR